MKPSPYDVLLPGVYFCDLVFTGLPGLPSLGKEIFGSGFDMLPGGTFNTVYALHRLGLHPGWVADFGSDFFSRFVLNAARKAGLDDSLFRLHDFPLQSVSASLSFPQDRAFISYVDHWDAPLPIDEVERLKPPCLLLPYLFSGDKAQRLFESARRQGSWIYMDCQTTEKTLADESVCQAIRSVDVFAPNASEALHLTGEKTVETALDCLASLAPLVVIKLGKDGVLARKDGRTYTSPALTVRVVDTTGAGDCFNAGFVYGHLKGRPLEDCLHSGNVCGGLSTTAGCLKVPTAREINRY